MALDGEGTLGDDALVWKSEGRPNPVSSDVPTPAFADGHFYVLSDVRSALSKVVAKTGEVVWSTEMPKDHLWRAHQRDAVADHRRRHQAPPLLAVTGVPGAPAPELFTGLGVVAGDHVAADHQHLLAALVADVGDHGGVRLE